MKNLTLHLSLAMLAGFPLAFDNKAGWKLDADGHVELKDGNPIWIGEDGNEGTIQPDTIKSRNAENKALREAKEAAEAKLLQFKDIDPAVARKAIETVGKLDAKKLIDAGEVDKLTEQIKGEYAAQLAERDGKLADAGKRLDDLTLSNAFAQSGFLKDRIAIPTEFVVAQFKDHFKVVDGKIVAYDKAGNPVHSSKNIGNNADVDEAFEKLIDAYPQKDRILKAPDQSGSGNTGSGGNRGGGVSIRRADFDKLDPVKQGETMKRVSAGELAFTD